jgi:hypothetical protein
MLKLKKIQILEVKNFKYPNFQISVAEQKLILNIDRWFSSHEKVKHFTVTNNFYSLSPKEIPSSTKSQFCFVFTFAGQRNCVKKVIFGMFNYLPV